MDGSYLSGLNLSYGPGSTRPGFTRKASGEKGEGGSWLPGSPSLASSTSLSGVSELGEDDSVAWAEAERRRVHEERASAAAATQPTLIEANADLLSVIAKNERKCLELNEGESMAPVHCCAV